MSEGNHTSELRRGWTTGACATAALAAAAEGAWGKEMPDRVTIALPGGQDVEFSIAYSATGENWVEAGVVKDAGDDPDVTHGALVKVKFLPGGDDVKFAAGDGVGTVTKPGLPIPPGEPAINPVPRQMMRETLARIAKTHEQKPFGKITVSIPDGETIAEKTWNPRLGIKGGLSILGTTGIVRPFSCSAWIASIHRGIDVAQATGLTHVAGCTGATSEKAVRAFHGLSDAAMLDMGDFLGGMLKYLRRHKISRLTVGGGIGKMTKVAQGAVDLHSARSQVDFNMIADWIGDPGIADMNTALEVAEKHGETFVCEVAKRALTRVSEMFEGHRGKPDQIDVIIVDRAGRILKRVAT